MELAQITGKALEESANSNVTEITNFSYKFKDDLKITETRGPPVDSDDDFERNNEDVAHQEFMKI